MSEATLLAHSCCYCLQIICKLFQENHQILYYFLKAYSKSIKILLGLNSFTVAPQAFIQEVKCLPFSAPLSPSKFHTTQTIRFLLILVRFTIYQKQYIETLMPLTQIFKTVVDCHVQTTNHSLTSSHNTHSRSLSVIKTNTGCMQICR